MLKEIKKIKITRYLVMKSGLGGRHLTPVAFATKLESLKMSYI